MRQVKQFWTEQCHLHLCSMGDYFLWVHARRQIFSILWSVCLAFWLGKTRRAMLDENHTVGSEGHAGFWGCSRRKPFWWPALCVRNKGTRSSACLWLASVRAQRRVLFKCDYSVLSKPHDEPCVRGWRGSAQLRQRSDKINPHQSVVRSNCYHSSDKWKPKRRSRKRWWQWLLLV